MTFLNGEMAKHFANRKHYAEAIYWAEYFGMERDQIKEVEAYNKATKKLSNKLEIINNLCESLH